MKNFEQEVQAIERKMQEEKEALRAKYAILEAIGDLAGYAPPNVHYYKLYGTRGSVSFRMQRYSAIAEGKSPDRALLARLLKQFPPTSKVMVRDGSVSFRPDEKTPGFNIAALKGEQEWRGEVSEVHPITVRLEVFQGPTVQFDWYAEVNGELWDFRVEYPLSQTDLGRLDVRYKRMFGRGEITRVEHCDFYPSDGNAQRIRWASGDIKTPNSFTIYWDTDSGNAVDFPGMVKESQ